MVSLFLCSPIAGSSSCFGILPPNADINTFVDDIIVLDERGNHSSASHQPSGVRVGGGSTDGVGRQGENCTCFRASAKHHSRILALPSAMTLERADPLFASSSNSANGWGGVGATISIARSASSSTIDRTLLSRLSSSFEHRTSLHKTLDWNDALSEDSEGRYHLKENLDG